tara:strand:+ start:102 stop:329 length:228 start_codon:yes stop_codon:yes gene_type:complete
MRQEEKIKAVELVKEWQKKRPNFSRNKLSQATGLAYATLVEFDKQGLITLPEKRHTNARRTAYNNARGMKDWLMK